MLRLKRFFFLLLNMLFFWMSHVFPKKRNLWIFGSWFGERYSDNSRYFYEYIKNNHKEIRAVWVTSSQKIYDDLKLRGDEVYKMSSLSAYFIALKASVSIYVQANQVDCLPFLNNKKVKLIQLRHGIPLKKIGLDDDFVQRKNGVINRVKRLIFPFIFENHDLMTACSEEDRKNFSTAFHAKRVKITGYARNDFLFSGDSANNDKYVITYLPTFRDGVGERIDLLTPYGFDFKQWDNFLEGIGVMYIKAHPVNMPEKRILDKMHNYKNIKILMECDAIDLLKITDILITDYSSVYFDFLLLDRPIVFAPFDFDNYLEKDRKLYYHYDDVTPGYKCKNWMDVFNSVKEIISFEDIYKNKRNYVKNRFHYYQDAEACSRIFGEIEKLF